ncbi:MAG: hypothetical protein HOE48_02390 [Candidatus Latescibacteria bacterium]|nr:hypothetical protein [Candidatus Latescibacterota bacterium]MBT4136730.1 hypothetical protein [Candidatus Latescibacterota bacterium]
MFTRDDRTVVDFSGVDFATGEAFVFCVGYCCQASAIVFAGVIVCPLAFLLGNDDI